MDVTRRTNMIGSPVDRPVSGRSTHRRRILALLLVLSLALVVGATGDLDVTFGDHGILTFGIGSYGSCGSAGLQQSSGKLVFAGSSVRSGSQFDFVVTRYNGNGALDTTFGEGGIAGADFNGLDDGGSAVLQQADGKLMLAGNVGVNDFQSDMGLARFSADGIPDETFGINGIVQFDAGGDNDYVSGVVEQPDGKIVIAGITSATGAYQIVLVRFTSDGTVDSSFGSDGRAVVDFGAGTTSWQSALLQQPDGRLLVVGNVADENGRNSDVAVARLTDEGQLDSSFDSDGLLTFDVGGEDGANAIALQSDGNIVVAGHTASDSDHSAVVMRVLKDGGVDSTFGTDGVTTSNYGDAAALSAIVAQPDDSLVALAGIGADVAVVKFSADGAIDDSYGVDGVSIIDVGKGHVAPLANGTALFRQDDGKHVVLACTSSGEFTVARIDDAGASPGRIGFKVTEQVVTEGDNAVSYVVRRTGGTSGAATVDYATTAGTAAAGSDFTGTTGVLSWADGDAAVQTIDVPIIDDSEAESNQDFTLRLSNPTGAVLAAGEATTTISSEDGPGELGFGTLDPVTVIEDLGSDPWAFRVYRSNGSEGAVTVDYEAQSGTAISGEDFNEASGTLSWADGETGSQEFVIAIVNDNDDEPAEDFRIVLSGPTGGATLGTLDRTLIVRIGESDVGEPALRFAGSAAVRVSEDGGSTTLTVSRSGSSVGAASVDYATAPGSAASGSDFTSAQQTLTWADGDSSDKTITIDIANDSTDEGDETFAVELSNPVGAPLGSPARVSITIDDDDSDDDVGGGGGGGGHGYGLALLAAALALRRLIASQTRRQPPVTNLVQARFSTREYCSERATSGNSFALTSAGG
jgi:uncharacterized delta-60 repeat protein